jgi:capsular exopolysaccharide synthesis family protein
MSDNEFQKSDLERILALLRRRWWLIVGCTVVFALLGLGLSLQQEKQYSATAELLFRDPGYAQDLFGTSVTQQNADPAREAATNEKLVGLSVIAKRTAKALGDTSWESISNHVEVAGEGEAELVGVTATDPDPDRAADIANTFARQFIKFRAEADRSKLLQAKSKAERSFEDLSTEEKASARGQSLSRGAERLSILASLQTGNAELVQPADPPASPSSPKTARNVVIGAILGLFLGLALAVFAERLNRKLQSPEEAESVSGVTVLGTIPDSQRINASNDQSAAQTLSPTDNEAFWMLRASLRYFNVDSEIKVVLVTSYEAAAGKSTVSWNLARAATGGASKAIVIEADLRKPHIASQHGLKSGPGLTQLLTNQASLTEVIQSKSIPRSPTGSGPGSDESVDVIVAGSIPPNPAELLESRTLEEVLASLREKYDLIVIDTAPIGVVADSFSVMARVDGVVCIARMRQTTRDSLAHLCERLRHLKAPVLGVVANGVRRKKRDGYGYGYYLDPDSDEPTDSRDGRPAVSNEASPS